MTDITELAQSLKAAAEKAKHAGETPVMPFDARISALNEYQITACPDNILALVAALEKAQRANAAQDDHINQQQDRIDQLEKGHQEAAKQINSWRRMAKQNIAEREKDIAELDAARQRIAELESRTVKLPDLRQIVSGDRYVWSDGVYNYSQDVKVVLAAAGIKVEAE
ncbi:ead/Ea22-like family protein [Klebsiella pneumoniae]|nr:ead/Ea22-like family protein [Klebsiella pneumoniae]MDF9973332.1 ead/Ea22-like family protein [Klebsiella pneumoniae]HDU4938300.1 ead/Ea22-like family protein [Klebsiella pneumoniae subsp. pneumoniae]HEN4851837.1 ead/Ea22-like family protein [Klebsiella pneumoniae]